MEFITTLFVVVTSIGIVLGLINALFGFVGGLDLDLFGFLPMGVTNIGFSFAMFGAVGLLMLLRGVYPIVALILAFIIAIVVFISLGKLKTNMKKSNPIALNSKTIVGQTGTLLTNLNDNKMGMLVLTDSTGASITYNAIKYFMETRDLLGIGQEVLVMKFNEETNTCYVIHIDTNKK